MNPVRGCTRAASPSPPYSRETLSKGFPVGYPLPTAALISQATIYSLGEYFRITTVAPRPREPTPSALPFPLLELSSREPILCHFGQMRAGLRLTYEYPSHWVSLSDSFQDHKPCCVVSSQIRPVRIMTIAVRPWQYTILYYVAPLSIHAPRSQTYAGATHNGLGRTYYCLRIRYLCLYPHVVIGKS